MYKNKKNDFWKKLNKTYFEYKKRRSKLHKLSFGQGSDLQQISAPNDKEDISRSSIIPEPNKKNKVAIIVPYRDNPEQDRASQLERFRNHIMEVFEGYNYKLYVIEQSDDGKKFNRGKLLNIGMKMAINEGYNILVSHDVDLLPRPNIVPYYTVNPSFPVHLGFRWKDKYSYSRFIGGVLLLTSDVAKKLNGYPNNFWGWGGEDDALYNRMLHVVNTIYVPDVGDYVELKHVDTGKIKKYTNMNKKHNILKDLLNWKSNGLNSLQYKLVKEDGGKYTVDI